MSTEEDHRLTLQRMEAQEREIERLSFAARAANERAEALGRENAELRGSGLPRRGGGRMIVGNWTKRVRMAFASSGALVAMVVLLALTAGVAVAVTFNGTFNAETLNGTNQPDTLDGKAGKDKIYGLGGNDDLFGNEGADTIQGGEGSDYVEGGEGNDVIDVGPGNDFRCGSTCTGPKGGPGNDTIKGGDGNDDLYGEGGDDKLYGGPGNNYLYGGPGANKYYGDDGADSIEANTTEADGGAKEVITTGAGDDDIYAKDGLPDQIKCGESDGDDDWARADPIDSVSDDCETVL